MKGDQSVLLQNVASRNVKSQKVRVTKRKHHLTLTTVTSLRLLTFTFCNYYVSKLLRLETITISDAM